MRTDKRVSQKPDKKSASRIHKRGIVGYSKKSALLEEAITHMNAGKYGRSSAALKELLALDPQNTEARRLFATLHLKLGSLVTARQAFESLANEAIGRQDYWLAESLLREYLAAGPRCVPFLEQLAQVYQEKGDEMAAVVELGRAIEILRDDPDPDHPQKAAQLYAKIRELAPASSVALQLAPLFDVRTGQFLVEQSAASISPAQEFLDQEPVSPVSMDANEAPAIVEHPLPDVMPWDVTDETSLSHETEMEQTGSAPVDVSVAPATPDVQQPETPAEPSFSYKVDDPSECDASIEDAVSTASTSQGASTLLSALPSPMPWEQMADDSVEILEAQPPPAADESSMPKDPSATLESILASLRTGDTAPTSVAESLQSLEVASSEPVQTGSASLPAPMPWEQVSDPAIEIPIADHEPESSPLPSVDPSEVTILAAEAAEATSEPEPIEQNPSPSSVPPLAHDAASESNAARLTEVSPAPSFSWNSVFDKAWNFTAGSIAPSRTAPFEKGVDESVEGMDQPPSVESESASSTATTTETTVTTAPPETVSLVEEELSVGAPPVSESTPSAFDAPAIEDAGSTPSEETPRLDAAGPLGYEPSSHWNTGEVAVQVHRPSKKKKRWEKEPEQTGLVQPPSEPTREWKTIDEPTPSARVEPAVAPPTDVRPEWMQATEAITFARPEPVPEHVGWSDAPVAAPIGDEPQNATATAAAAVDVLFAASPISENASAHDVPAWSKPRPRFMARVHRVRIGVSSFIGSCFSTTRSLTFLAVMISLAIVAVACSGMATLAVLWMVLEEPPTPVYEALTVSPPRIITEAKKNGYVLLLGLEAPDNQDPVKAGYERKAQPERDRAAAQVCMGAQMNAPGSTGGASEQIVKEWIRSGDVLATVKGQGPALKSLISRESAAVARYQQWLTMPFDDWGFGQSFSPHCPHVLLVHRLFMLDGFSQDLSTGVERLEADAQAWRGALGQAKTLPMKMLALSAVQDDASIASGLLSRAELDGAALTRLTKIVRPLDQVELSIRWPMQSQFVSATKAVASELKDSNVADRSWPASLAAAMRLPVQRRANGYAEYYDAANKAVAGGRYAALPKVSAFVRTPPSSLMDYVINPVEHIVGIEPLPTWDPFVHRVIETDARLRLAGLQAWIRRGPQDDVLTRLAKAGQAYYDPFTGLPMLVNQRKGVMYSVGRDGKDQEGDELLDVTAMIPPVPSSDSRRSFPSVR